MSRRARPGPYDPFASSQLTLVAVTKASLWGASATAIATGVRAIRVIVVAPFVSAHDYGLLVVTLAILDGMNAFSELGTQASLVRHQGRVADLLDAAFALQALRGIALAILLLAAAPATGRWFGDDALVSVARTMALVPLIGGFSNPAMVLLARRLEFRRLFGWSLAESAITLAVGLGLAMALRSVWALVLAAVAGEVVRVSVSYAAARPWPRWSLPRAATTQLLRFGRWVFGTRVLMYLSVRGDDMFVATMLGTTAAGVYAVAFRISELPVLLVTHAIVNVAFPVWGGLASEPQRLRWWFLRTCASAAAVNAAVSATLLAAAPYVLPLPRGMLWEATRPLMLILLLASFARSVIVLAEPYFYSVGRPGVWFAMNACRVATSAILIVPLSDRYGLVGVGMAVAAGLLAAVPIAMRALLVRHFNDEPLQTGRS